MAGEPSTLMDKIPWTLFSAVIGAVVLLVGQRLRKWIDVHAQYNSALELLDYASSKAIFTGSAQQLFRIAKRDSQYLDSTIRILELAVRERSERSREDWIGGLRAMAGSEQGKSSEGRDYTRWYGYLPRPRNPECAELVRLIILLLKPHDCDDTDQSWFRRCRARLGSHIHKLTQRNMFHPDDPAHGRIELAFADLRDLTFIDFKDLVRLGCDVNLDNADLRLEQEHCEKVYELLNNRCQESGVNGAKVSLNGAWLAARGDTGTIKETNFAVELAKREDSAGLFLVGDHSLENPEGHPGEFEGVRITGGPGVQLRNRCLRGVNFQHSLLMGADFSHSDLAGATFGFADITEARLERVDKDKLNVDQFINTKRTDTSFPDGLFPDTSQREADDKTRVQT